MKKSFEHAYIPARAGRKVGMKKRLVWLAALVLFVAVAGCRETMQADSREAVETQPGLAATQADERHDSLAASGTQDESAVLKPEETQSGFGASKAGETQSGFGASGPEGTQDGLSEAETTGEEAAQCEPEKGDIPVQRPKVRGIYVTGPMAGTANMDNLIDMVERTELNAMVIDIKNDEGYVTCDMDAPTAAQIGSVKRYVRDMPELVRKCKEKGIYLIARIVAFKDPFLADAKPDWSLHNADGTIFRDKSRQAWVNPYEKQVWEYLLEIAEGAVSLGFDEVQFDYIRFSTDKGMKQVDFGAQAQGKEKTEVISEFAAYAAQRLHKAGAAVSADVYGVVIDSALDQQIVGQDYVALAQHLDYLSPMVYPSHYGPYNYNIPVPDAQPYQTVLAAMQASKKVLAGVMEPDGTAYVDENKTPDTVSGNGLGADAAGETETVLGKEEIAKLSPLPKVRADVRPWLQDFTATWVKGHIQYGPQQIRDQIQAVYDAGYEEWILWNAANRYTEGGLHSAAWAGHRERVAKTVYPKTPAGESAACEEE